jgi:hypothetical protein
MRLIRLGLLVPLCLAACGQSLQPLQPFDAGIGSDDLAAGGGGRDMTKGGDLYGLPPVDGGCSSSSGPSITIDKPTSGSFVRGVFEVSATIDDPCGIDASSVIAEFGNNASAVVTLTRVDAKTFAGVFDVHVLAPNYVLAALSVRAKNTIGNESQIGEEVIIDIVKPWMTMDSAPTMHVAKHDAMNNIECSKSFSPLGNDAAHEGQVVQQLITLRTRIEDHGNLAPGLTVERFSTVDQSSVQMFVIHDDGMTALAVDTDGDTHCDDVNPLLIPTAGPVMMQNQALSLQMVPLPGTGTPDYTSGSSPPPGCFEIGDAATTMPPKSICTTTPLTYVLGYSGGLPAIYTLPPVKTGDPVDCTGFQLDSANQLPEGPACVVTRAIDKAGNVEVSFPLHICIDRGGGMCSGYSPTASHCTGVYDPVTMTLKAGTCTAPLVAGSAPLDGPATFPTDGSDVEFIGP